MVYLPISSQFYPITNKSSFKNIGKTYKMIDYTTDLEIQDMKDGIKLMSKGMFSLICSINTEGL